MKLLRKRMKIVIWIAAVSFIALIFLSWGLDITRRSPTGMLQRGIVGKVNGRIIRMETYREMLNRAFMSFRGESDAQVDGLTSTLIEDRVFEQIVQEDLLREEIIRRGITVSDAEVLAFIKSVPPEELRSDTSFMTDGEFDVEKYRQVFQNPANLPWLMEYERYVKQALPKQKLMLTLYSTARLTDLEMGYAFSRRNATVKLRYLLVTPERAGKGAEPSEDEVRRYYEEHAEEFELPVTAVVSYAHFSTAPSPSDSAASLQEVRGINEELKAGADYEKLAKQVSQDQQTAEQGGLLGWIKRGQVVKVFEDAAFSLKKGQVSEPILSNYGWHIIKLNDKKADSAEVSHILIRIDSSSETIDRARESAVLFREDVEEMGLASAAVSHGVELRRTPPFSGRGNYIPTIGYSRVIKDFAFTSQPGNVSRVLATGVGFYVLRLDSLRERHVPSFESLTDTLTVLARGDKNIAQTEAVADSARSFLSEGLSMKQVASRLNLEYGVTREFSATSALPDYPIELIGAAMALDENKVSSPVRTEKGCYIVQVIERTTPGLEEFDKASPTFVGSMMDSKQRRIVDQWLAMLREKSDIRDYRGEIYR